MESNRGADTDCADRAVPRMTVNRSAPYELMVRAIGLYQAAFASLGTFTIAKGFLPAVSAFPVESRGVFATVLALYLLFFVLLACTGVAVASGSWKARTLFSVLLTIQIPRLSVAGFYYLCSVGVSAGATAGAEGIRWIGTIGTELRFALDSSEVFLGIDAIPVLIVWLLYRSRNELRGRTRLL